MSEVEVLWFNLTTVDLVGPFLFKIQILISYFLIVYSILDDVEIYEQNKPFGLDNLIAVSNLLNYFVFRTIWNGLIGR